MSSSLSASQRWPLALRLLGKLSFPMLYRIADLIAVLAYWGSPKYRRLVYDNLRRCFPQHSSAERRRLAKKFYRNLADLALETARAATMTPADFAERVQFSNLEVLQTFRQRNRPVVLLPTHQCNWEWLLLASSLCFPLPLAVVYRPLSQPRYDALMLALRTRFGATLVSTASPVIEYRRWRESAMAIAIVADQTPRRGVRDKYWTRWFGQETAFSLGPETIARLTRAPVLFVEMRRLARGRYRVDFVPLAEPPYRKQDHLISRAYAEMCERLIRSAPSDWLWSYRRWRYPNPGSAGQDRAAPAAAGDQGESRL